MNMFLPFKSGTKSGLFSGLQSGTKIDFLSTNMFPVSSSTSSKGIVNVFVSLGFEVLIFVALESSGLANGRVDMRPNALDIRSEIKVSRPLLVFGFSRGKAVSRSGDSMGSAIFLEN